MEEKKTKEPITSKTIESAADAALEDAISYNEQRVKGLDGKEVGKHVLFALAIGVVCAAASVVLCLCVNGAFAIFSDHHLLLWAIPVFGILSLLLYKAWKLPLGLLTKSVVDDMRKDIPISKFLAPGVLIGTVLTVLGGGAVGKEAGVMQMGASLGSLVSRPFRIHSVYKKDREEKMAGYCSATGMAAALSALFFAPLGAAFLVLELCNDKKSIGKHFLTIVLACFVSFFIAKAIGIGDVIDPVNLPELSWSVVGQCVVIGVMAAIVGSLFSFAIDTIQKITLKIRDNYYLWVVIGGVIFALLIFFCNWFGLAGPGGINLNDALHGKYGSWDFAIRVLLTAVCLGFWFKGGEIMPTLCVGGLLGASCTALTGGDPAFGAAIGTMSTLAAFSGCPIGAFFMGCEIFGYASAPWFAISIVLGILITPSVNWYDTDFVGAVKRNLNRLAASIRKNG